MARPNPKDLDLLDPALEKYLSPKEIRKLTRKQKRQARGNQINHVVEIERYRKKELTPKTKNQSLLKTAIQTTAQTVTIGPAGTGKTYVPAFMAATMMIEKKIEKIIITRPNVPAGPTIGLFPGTLEEKMAPWVEPIISVLKDVMGAHVYEIAKKNGDIVVVPFEVIRGRTFENAFVILDEAQNTTESEMQAFLTRIGEDSKVVINGDIAQKDLKGDSGLSLILRILNKDYNLYSQISVIEFTSDDVVRSGICRDWIKAFERDEKDGRKIHPGLC